MTAALLILTGLALFLLGRFTAFEDVRRGNDRATLLRASRMAREDSRKFCRAVAPSIRTPVVGRLRGRA